MHSTEALPLPPRPDADHYRKLAKELTAVVRSGGEAAIAAWATNWLGRLMRSSGEPLDDRLTGRIDRDARQFAAYWMGTRLVKEMPPPRPRRCDGC